MDFRRNKYSYFPHFLTIEHWLGGIVYCSKHNICGCGFKPKGERGKGGQRSKAKAIFFDFLEA
jgi:hypothetical protein